MKVSLVIPATVEHFLNIESIIAHYINGTSKPDQIVVSISLYNSATFCEFNSFFEPITILSGLKKS